MIKNVKRLLPVIIMLILIAFLTLQSPEETLSLSGGMQRFLKALFPDATGRWTIDMHWFRTLLHLPLYFLLGIVVCLKVPKFWRAVGICSIVALADEIFKIFLPTREFGALDLIFDAIGFLAGISLVMIIRWIRRKRLVTGKL